MKNNLTIEPYVTEHFCESYLYGWYNGDLFKLNKANFSNNTLALVWEPVNAPRNHRRTDCKLILRLLDLTVPIIKDGKEVNIIEWLYRQRFGTEAIEFLYLDYAVVISYKLMGETFKDTIHKADVSFAPYWLVQGLIKEKYDVFGLIEKGLAVAYDKDIMGVMN